MDPKAVVNRPSGRPVMWTLSTLMALIFLFPAPPLRGQLPVPPVGAAEEEGGAVLSVAAGAPYVHSAAPVSRAIRLSEEIRMDGRVDEPAWVAAVPVTDFTQLDPAEGEPATQRTEVRIAFDDQAVYIGAILFDSGPVTTRLARRDAGLSDSDFFVVLLDSYHDHETAYRFSTNPSGVKRDAVVSGGGSGGGDSSWDPVWDLATAIIPEGWSVEMRIPFSQLRFSPADEQTWGIQFERSTHRLQENVVFPFTPKLERGGPARFAHLEGIRAIEPGQRLELLPYVVARAEFIPISQHPATTLENPFRSGRDAFASAGADLKFRLTSNVTLDATVNPDFGQVELDPAVINLTAFETRFSERRPFFVEGADIFRFGEGGPAGSTGQGPQLLYSRRIGRSPLGPVPGGALYVEPLSETTILGAAKITGRVGDGWSMGILEAVTAREHARYVDADGTRQEVVVEAPTNYLVARLRRQIRGGETRFGIIASAVNRQLTDSGLEERQHRQAYAGGIDFAHDWDNRSWRVASTFTASYVQGSARAIERTQRSSTRYYQRPDADHLDFDPAATSLAGYYAMVDVAKLSGAYGIKVALAFASPGYEVNDLGFQSASDRIILDTNFDYAQNRPGRHFRSWNTRGGPDAIWNYGGDRIFTEVNYNLGWTWLNYWGAGFRLAWNPEVDDDRLTRGGPMGRSPQAYSGTMNATTDTRKVYVARWNGGWSVEDGGSWHYNTGLNLTARPSETMTFTAGPSFSRRHSAAQYVSSVADPHATATSERRYIYAPLHQTTVSMQTRANVTFTPNLSLELVAEPFISTGRYGTFREFAAPRTFQFLTYGEDIGTITRLDNGFYRIDPDGDGPANAFNLRDQDFTRLSLLGNAVLRWEWRPGSTVFLVWQQRRTDTHNMQGNPEVSIRPGEFDLGRDTRELFGLNSENIFVIKVNYWLNP